MVNYLLVNARYDHSTKIHSNNLQYEKDQTRESLWLVALISLQWKQITPKIFAL